MLRLGKLSNLTEQYIKAFRKQKGPFCSRRLSGSEKFILPVIRNWIKMLQLGRRSKLPDEVLFILCDMQGQLYNTF